LSGFFPHGLPHHPLGTCFELLRDVLYPDRKDPRFRVHREGFITLTTGYRKPSRKPRQDRKFCDDACRQQHHYTKRRNLGAKARSFEGFCEQATTAILAPALFPVIVARRPRIAACGNGARVVLHLGEHAKVCAPSVKAEILENPPCCASQKLLADGRSLYRSDR
jgi:hypothetical protein